MRPLQAIKKYCRYDCKGNSPSKVRECEEVDCFLWDYRLGKNPKYKRYLTKEEREEAGRRLKEGRVKAGLPNI
jgi:hypothetical protein